MSLPYNPEAACAALTAADPTLGAWIKRVGPFTLTLRSVHSPFASLLRSIVYQQLSGKAAGTIYGRVLAHFGDQTPTPKQLQELPETALREAGLSRAKVAAVKDLAEKTLTGTVPDATTLATWSDDEIIAQLTQVRGIGPWTVQMMLMFTLGRPDVMPAHDLGVRKGFAKIFAHDDLPTPKALSAYAERWRPYRSVASWYCWRVLDLD